jgi:ATP-dependent RNA helicase DDX54/DBP10
VRDADMPYLLDLQLFLSRKLVLGQSGTEQPNFAEDIVVRSLSRDALGKFCEWASKLLDEDEDLNNLRTVADKGDKLYSRTKNSASSESAKRSREILMTESVAQLSGPFDQESNNDMELERDKILARVSNFRPSETVFEIGKRGNDLEVAEIMRRRRANIARRLRKLTAGHIDEETIGKEYEASSRSHQRPGKVSIDGTPVSDDEAEDSSPNPTACDQQNETESWKDPTHFMSYAPKSFNMAEDRAYGVHSGSYNAQKHINFAEAVKSVTMDLTNDESRSFAEPSKARGFRWDKKSKKYVARANDEDGSKSAKMVIGESGQRIAASFRSGRFDAWRKNNNVGRLPRTGEQESSRQNASNSHKLKRRFRHNAERAPKEADRFRDDFQKRKKRVEEAKEKRIGKFKNVGAKNELHSIDDIRKQRRLKEKRREKNGRPSKKKVKS